LEKAGSLKGFKPLLPFKLGKRLKFLFKIVTPQLKTDKDG